jgi:WD40 repeat protein/tRNA A-37 threonylcarbamoyl transferase component Bud32
MIEAMPLPDERQNRLQELLLAYVEAAEQGRAPDRFAFLARHPEFAAELAGFFAGQDRLDDLAAPLCWVAQAVLQASPAPTDSLLRGDADPGESPSLPAAVWSFAGYELLQELGRGGMGVVYKARQKNLNRLVALKMIRAGDFASPAEVQRFRNEAEAAALLDHPAIVPIHEVGEHEGRLYFSMKLIEGGSLATQLKRFEADPRSAAALVAAIAQAVHHAHQRGILHRDLKPANILLDEAGRPFVSDFGLAKRFAQDTGLTGTGELIGTPAYMAPEQAAPVTAPGHRGGREERLRATTALDVYGLGTVLYALLTGRAPFQGDTPLDTLDQVRSSEPVPPGRIRAEVDRDLEAVCLKCLEKQPARRYGSAEALAEDLERWLAGEPTLARPFGPLGRALRWCRRKPLHTALIALVVLLLVGSMTALVVGLVAMARSNAVDQERAAALRRQLYAADMRLAYDTLQHGEANQLLNLLAGHEPKSGEEDLRSFEWFYLKRLADSLPRERVCYRGHGCEVMCAIFAPDGREVVSGDENGAIHFWDPRTGVPRAVWRGHKDDVNGLHFSPDGRTLASGGEDGTVRLWDVATGKVLAQVRHPDGEVEGVCFSPDGRRVVAPGAKGRVCVWNVKTRALELNIPAHTERAFTAVFSPDGGRIASVSHDGYLRVWASKDGQRLVDTRLDSPVYDVCYSPDGSQIATADGACTIRLRSAADGHFLRLIGVHSAIPRAVIFSPDGRRVASGGDDAVLRVWDAALAHRFARGKTHSATTTAIAYAPDGNMMVTASRDHTIRVWEFTPPSFYRVVPTAPAKNTRAVFSPDGGSLTTWSPGGEILVWDRSGVRKLGRLRLAANHGHLLAFAPDRRSFGVSLSDGDLGILSLETEHKPILWRRVFSHPVSLGQNDAMAFAPDGSLIVHDYRLRWLVLGTDPSQKPDLRHWPRGAYSTLLLPSPDGHTLAVGADDTVRIWDWIHQDWQGDEVRLPASPRSLAYSPDGRVLAVGRTDGRITLLDPDSGDIRRSLYGHSQEVVSVAFSSDGRTLASGSLDGTVRLWHVATQQELFTLEDRQGRAVRSVAFSPDGEVLVTAGDPIEGDRNVTLWYGGRGTE